MAIVQTLIGNIKGPQGATGPQGEQGVAGNAATITVGTTSTTAYGNPAQVTNVGSSSDAILNFVIPQGRTGESVTELDDLTLNTITTATAEYPQIAIGDTGSTIFGKIVKFFQDLVSKKVDTSAVVNNFTTTQAGYVADARTVSTLMDALTSLVKTATYTGTTDANGRLASTGIPLSRKIISAYCGASWEAMPYQAPNNTWGFRITSNATNVFSVVPNASVTVTYYYIET